MKQLLKQFERNKQCLQEPFKPLRIAMKTGREPTTLRLGDIRGRRDLGRRRTLRKGTPYFLNEPSLASFPRLFT